VTDALALAGVSLIAGRAGDRHEETFRAYQPADGRAMDPYFYSASDAELDEAATSAAEAAPVLAASNGADRAALLRAMADGMDRAGEALVDRAHLETALPRPRLTGEVARTSNQLRLFADVAAEGSWVMTRSVRRRSRIFARCCVRWDQWQCSGQATSLSLFPSPAETLRRRLPQAIQSLSRLTRRTQERAKLRVVF
jgi:delta 1-pyrroline-5-carboxylate dehydrogenase